MADIKNAIVYVWSSKNPTFAKYDGESMPTTEAHAKELVRSWESLNKPSNLRKAKYVILENVVADTTTRVKELMSQGKSENDAINQASTETQQQINSSGQITQPTPSKLPWILGGIITVAAIAGVAWIRNK